MIIIYVLRFTEDQVLATMVMSNFNQRRVKRLPPCNNTGLELQLTFFLYSSPSANENILERHCNLF